MYIVGYKPTVILYTKINRHAETQNRGKTRDEPGYNSILLHCVWDRMMGVNINYYYYHIIIIIISHQTNYRLARKETMSDN